MEDAPSYRGIGVVEKGGRVPSRSDHQDTGVLLRSLRQGSSGAWARVYDEFAPGIRRFAATRLSGDLETAEDVVVETLARAARHIRQFLPEKASLSAWLYGIARQRVQEELRRRRRRKSVPAWAQVSFEDLSELADSHDQGARTAARLDAQTRIAHLANTLSDTESELLTLSAIDELPVRELGRVVGCSEQAAHSALHRARHKARRTAIEGTLLCGELQTIFEAPRISGSGHWFTGLEDWRSGGEAMVWPELSPAGDEVVYYLHGPEAIVYPPVSAHIWKASRDGSGAVNLSERAGMGGINWYPSWSPDATMIAFVRVPAPDTTWQGGGDASGQIWVMKADGSGAHGVTRGGNPQNRPPTWSPDGSRLLCGLWHEGRWRTIVVDTSGRGTRMLPEVGFPAVHSPDASMIASIRHAEGEVEGERGQWNRLLITRADGSKPRVVVEQFIADEGVATHRHLELLRGIDPRTDWAEDLRNWAGPCDPTWSPKGDKISFLAAMPFDPEGLPYRLQVDVWVYDLVTKRLIKITNEPTLHHSLSWR